MSDKPTIELTDTDGNVFAIMAQTRKQLRRQGREDLGVAIVKEITKTARDYDHALRIIMQHCEVI